MRATLKVRSQKSSLDTRVRQHPTSDFRLRTSALTPFLFYGGKGGVGKTTCAAARAVAEAAAGRRVLVVSTDPAHSLGDALGVRLSRRAAADPAAALRALELDAPRAFARWLRDHRAPLGDILEHGTWLDRDDVEAMMDLSMPGVDELVGLLEISRLAHAGTADLIVVDTAPTGHTLRLLAAPETVGAVADVFDALQVQHRVIREQLAGVGAAGSGGSADRALERAGHRHRARSCAIRAPTFHWVTLPEDLSVEETTDALATFDRSDLHVAEVVVNRVLPADGPCPICDRRRASESAAIARIRRGVGRGRGSAGGAGGAPGAARSHGAGRDRDGASRRPSSVARVRTIAASRAAAARKTPSALRSAPKRCPAEDRGGDRGAPSFCSSVEGGVGKTTVAAATAHSARARAPGRARTVAVHRSRAFAGRRARCAGRRRAAHRRRRAANLFVREVDAPRALAARARGDLRGGARRNRGGVRRGSGESQLTADELMDLAPPGVDELFGMLSVFDARAELRVIIVDTAPTGHALRLLEMPETAREWVQLLLRVLLKYRSLVRPGSAGRGARQALAVHSRTAGAAARPGRARASSSSRARRKCRAPKPNGCWTRLHA